MKILIVEDEVKTGDYLRQGLTEAGFVVDLARDGLDGLHLALNGDYDLIVLDVMLPDVDGWELLTLLHANERTQHIPVLVCSVVKEQELALSLGASYCVSKPIGRQAFIAALDAAVARSAPAAGPPRP